jgi:hypothetical protein
MARDLKLPDPCDPPPIPELHASLQSLSSVSNPAYWSKLCPKLHVANKASFDATQPLELDSLALNWRGQVDESGVAHVSTGMATNLVAMQQRCHCDLNMCEAGRSAFDQGVLQFMVGVGFLP